MTKFEKIMKEMTPEKLAVVMMCPYEGEEIKPCEGGARTEWDCIRCCSEYLRKEVQEDDEGI